MEAASASGPQRTGGTRRGTAGRIGCALEPGAHRPSVGRARRTDRAPHTG